MGMRSVLFSLYTLSCSMSWYYPKGSLNIAPRLTKRSHMEQIVPELAKQYGVTEQLKAEKQMEWVRQINACKAQAEGAVKAELIYD